jgi:hypothetical protein
MGSLSNKTKEQCSVVLCVLATARLYAAILVVLRTELTVAVSFGAPYRIDDGQLDSSDIAGTASDSSGDCVFQ